MGCKEEFLDSLLQGGLGDEALQGGYWRFVFLEQEGRDDAGVVACGKVGGLVDFYFEEFYFS